MKTKKTNLLKKLLLCIFLVILVLSSSFVFASDEDSTNTADVDEETEYTEDEDTDSSYVSSDLFLHDDNIEISNFINGNVVIYGENVTVNSHIQGDLIVIANNLNITEDAIVYGNVVAYAPSFVIGGTVSDVYAISSDFTLEETGLIERNLDLASKNVYIYGKVYRDANIYTSTINFGESEVGALIANNLNYYSSSELDIPDNIVGGNIQYTSTENNESTEDIVWSYIASIIKTLCFSLVVILLSIWISPKLSDRLGMMVKNNSVKSFLIGLLIFVVIAVVSIFLLLFTSGLGTTIAICLIALLVLACFISGTIFAMSIAKLITNKLNIKARTPFVLFSLLVILIISLIKLIPYVGIAVTALTSLVGLGMLGMNFYQRKTLYKVDEEK